MGSGFADSCAETVDTSISRVSSNSALDMMFLSFVLLNEGPSEWDPRLVDVVLVAVHPDGVGCQTPTVSYRQDCVDLKSQISDLKQNWRRVDLRSEI